MGTARGEAARLYKQREQRPTDTVALQVPDRVPIVYFSTFWHAAYAGYTVRERYVRNRREFMKTIGAAGTGLLAQSLASSSSSAEAEPSSISTKVPEAPTIDVHHHILPPEYVSSVGRAAIGAPIGGHAPEWTVQRSLAAMDSNGIGTAIVSISAPGVWLVNASATQRLARSCNEFAAQLCADYPGRFGFFASLPLPDVKSGMAEIAHAFDALRCDGIVLMTNYEDKYLGDPLFTPILDELNRRKAVVFVHPAACTSAFNAMPGMPIAMIEFPHDTTRTIVSLLFSGTFSQCRDIRFIFSHAGGTILPLADRIAAIPMVVPELAERVPEGVMPVLQRLYYDTAISANPISLSALLRLVPPTRVVFGSDSPFAPEALIRATVDGVSNFVSNAEDLKAIKRENALTMFPRLAELRQKRSRG